MNNDLKISNSDTKYVFQKPMVNKKNLLYSNLFKNYINKTNTFLIEIGSMKTYINIKTSMFIMYYMITLYN